MLNSNADDFTEVTVLRPSYRMPQRNSTKVAPSPLRPGKVQKFKSMPF